MAECRVGVRHAAEHAPQRAVLLADCWDAVLGIHRADGLVCGRGRLRVRDELWLERRLATPEQPDLLLVALHAPSLNRRRAAARYDRPNLWGTHGLSFLRAEVLQVVAQLGGHAFRVSETAKGGWLRC